MAKERLVVIKEAEITNNCPVCYNQKLGLQFFQRHVHTPLYHKTTKDISHEIKCKKCHSIIYPVKWTDDIERVFDYYHKLVEPDKKSVRFTTLFYVLMVLLLSGAGALLYLYLEGFI